MHLFLTSVLPFLAHDHPSAVAFLTCRHHNFHSSIIPEFLSDEVRVKSFFEASQQNYLYQLKVLHEGNQYWYLRLYDLFVQTPLMQFSPCLLLHQEFSTESIFKPLLATKYFSRTLQRCTLGLGAYPEDSLFHSLSKVQSLIRLDLAGMRNQRLELIINTFPSLETLIVHDAAYLDPTAAFSISSPPPPATKTLRNLTMWRVNALFATQFIPHLTNLRKLHLSANSSKQGLDIPSLASSLPLLADLTLERFCLDNLEPLKNLHLSSLGLIFCRVPDSLSFLRQENHLTNLTKLLIQKCDGLSPSSFASSLSHAPNLQVLEIVRSSFNNECLQYLENMVHLRKLDLSETKISGDNRSLTTLMQNLFQLEELNLSHCHIGNQGAIAGAIYSTHSRLRVLNLSYCELVDDDLNGIGALKNTLEVLDLSYDRELTNEALVHCKELMKLKRLNVANCSGITDLSSLKSCLNLEQLYVAYCHKLKDESFAIFSDEPNSFPNLRVLDLSHCKNLRRKVFEHLAKNNNLLYRLKELNVDGMSEMLLSSSTARNSIYQLKGLHQLRGIFSCSAGAWFTIDAVKREVFRNLKNLEKS